LFASAVARRSPVRYGHTVVLGAGMAGLLAARVLADHFERVTVIDADRLPTAPEPRSGVPQGKHAHGLMAGGLNELDRLFPGFSAELRQRGGVPVDLGADFTWGLPFGWGCRFTADLNALVASRGLLEWTVRQRVLGLPTVTIRDRQRAETLLGTPDRVASVRLRQLTDRSSEDLDADLVVDATGRGTRVEHWLAEIGCAPPPSTVVDAHIGYATRVFEIPPDPPSWRACSLMLIAPQTRGGILVTVEGDRWVVTLAGVGADRPSARDEDFLPYARSLASPTIADAIATATPLTSVVTTHSTSNHRRHMEQLAVQPANLLLAGDAACAFNPIYAQGMTMAILGAGVLRDQLRRADSLAGFAPRYHRRLAALHNRCWMMSTTADSRFATTDGPAARPVQRTVGRYFERVIVAGTRDRRVQAAYLDVVNMTRHPATLMRPNLLYRVARAGARPASGTLAPRPPGEREPVTSGETA
jgi:2-polyprenyl-6-methoxyphenol hydroxylase-like FAD-dependent oxidoreductase